MAFTYFLYFSILIVGSSLAFCAEKAKNKDTEFFFRFLLFIVFLLPAVFRYNIAADYANYKIMYDNDLFWEYAEAGFSIICSILKFLNCSSFWMFFTISFLTFFLLCFFVKKNKFAFFIFFYIAFYGYFNAFDQIRQALALPFVIFSFYNLLEKKYLGMFLNLILATLFHKSSMVFFMLLPLSQIGLKKYHYLLFC